MLKLRDVHLVNCVEAAHGNTNKSRSEQHFINFELVCRQFGDFRRKVFKYLFLGLHKNINIYSVVTSLGLHSINVLYLIYTIDSDCFTKIRSVVGLLGGVFLYLFRVERIVNWWSCHEIYNDGIV